MVDDKRLRLSDSHCHLDFDELSSQLDNLLNTCKNKSINRLIVPAIAPSNWQAVLDICNHNTINIHPCLGIHPWFLDDLDISCILDLKNELIKNRNNVVALGEAGIDGTIAKEKDNIEKQIDFFEAQLALADSLSLPVIVHHRRSHQEVVSCLKKYDLSRAGIIHAFSGSYQQAKQYLDLGFKLGIGGTITYPRAAKTIKTVSKLPLDSLVLETDAPAMPLYGYQGKTNTPERIVDVLDALTAIRLESKEELAFATEVNLEQCLFT